MKWWLAPAVIASALLAVATAAPASTLFALVDTGELFASADGGATWSVRAVLPVHDAVALQAGSTPQQLVIATASGTVYRSSDAGSAWSAVGAVPAADVVALAAAPARLLLFSRSGSVYASADQGGTWSAVGAITAGDVVSAASDGASVHALTATGGVHRSTDAGATWVAVGALPTSGAIEIVARSGVLNVLGAAGEIWRSLDAGATWAAIGTVSQVGMTSLTVHGGELVAAVGAGECAASIDGTAWAWRGAVNQLTVRALANDVPLNTGVGRPPEPTSVALGAPWPNPTRGPVTVALALPRAAVAELRVFDLAGRRVSQPLPPTALPAGTLDVTWRPRGVAAGLYLLEARTDSGRPARRRVVILE